jgi:hypothetical protein
MKTYAYPTFEDWYFGRPDKHKHNISAAILQQAFLAGRKGTSTTDTCQSCAVCSDCLTSICKKCLDKQEKM